MDVTSVIDAATDSEDSVGLNETLCYTGSDKKGGLENAAVSKDTESIPNVAISGENNSNIPVDDTSIVQPVEASETPTESPGATTPTSTKKHSHNIGELAKATFDMSGDETSQDNID